MASESTSVSGPLTVDERQRRRIQRRAISANLGTVSLMIVTGGLSSDILQPEQIGLAPGLLPAAFSLQYFCIPLARRPGKKHMMQPGYGASLLALCPFLRCLRSSR